MRLADSSFLYALFLTGDPNSQRAEREAAVNEPILVPSEVLAETLGVLARRKGIDFARMAKHWLESKPHFQMAFTQRQHYDIATRFFARPPERLNYVDALLVAWARVSGARLVTYDEGLARAVKREIG